MDVYEYHIPFTEPLHTGKGTITHRDGIVFSVSGPAGPVWSEIAPLPGFSSESLDEVKTVLQTRKEEIGRFLCEPFTPETLSSFLDTLPSVPSFQFGLSMLGLSLLSARQHRSFAGITGIGHTGTVRTNALIGARPVEEIKQPILDAVREGFDTIKIKVPHPSAALVRLLSGISEAFPNVRFRLDANQGWSVGQLAGFSEQISELPVEYIEEPVHIREIRELEDVKNASALPVALDETIFRTDTLPYVLEHHPDVFLVIKPMMLGNMLTLAGTFSSFRSMFDRIVVTTSLESAIGRSMVSAVAGWIGDKKRAHGLETGHLFTEDLVPHSAKTGEFSAGPGMAFRPPHFDQILKGQLKRLG